MKLTTVLSFVFIFGLVVVAGATLFNDTANHYGIGLSTNVSTTYDKIQDYYDEINVVEDQIKGSESAATDTADVGSGFIANIKAMWSTVQLFFNNFKFVTELSTGITKDLGIPAVVVNVVSGLILLSLLALIISIAVRWKVD